MTPEKMPKMGDTVIGTIAVGHYMNLAGDKTIEAPVTVTTVDAETGAVTGVALTDRHMELNASHPAVVVKDLAFGDEQHGWAWPEGNEDHEDPTNT